MREMKDSGIEWIGEIPKEWSVVKVKHLCKVTDGTHFSPQTTEVGKPYITVSNVNNSKIDIQGALTISEEDFETLVKQGCQPKIGDVLLSKDGTVGRTAVVMDDNAFVCLSSLGILSPCNYLYSSFLKYMLDSILLQDQMIQAMAGSALRRITISKINDFLILLPAKTEQRVIADFLDTQCSEIDATAENIQKEISLLEDYKKSVITEAVTKGLNPDAEMKDSGIEWIGEIPKHWKVIRFKYIAIVKSNLVAPIRYMNYPQIAPDVIEKNTGKIISHRSVEEANVDSWNHLFYKGQILYSKIRPVLNKVVIAPYDGLCSADMYPISAKENVRFLQYIMLSAFFVKQVDLVTRDRIKMPKINQDELGNILLVWTSKEEQQQIADFLDSKCSEIDSLIADKKRQLDILADYKKSLIYEYVTGKKEVPVKDF